VIFIDEYCKTNETARNGQEKVQSRIQFRSCAGELSSVLMLSGE